jgi:oxalate decarboxylase/phosphoglucose isomerase-like protein (cupin superfamily)
MSIEKIKLPKIKDVRGNLTFIQNLDGSFPFSINRIFYMYDIPSGSYRGAHAHKNLEQFIIAISGSFELITETSEGKKSFFLNNPHEGVYIPSMTWQYLQNFSSGAVCLVLASDVYKEDDYIRDYDIFKKLLEDD